MRNACASAVAAAAVGAAADAVTPPDIETLPRCWQHTADTWPEGIAVGAALLGAALLAAPLPDAQHQAMLWHAAAHGSLRRRA